MGGDSRAVRTRSRHAKQSARQITEVFERIEALRNLNADKHPFDVSDVILRRRALRLVFSTDHLLLMIHDPTSRVQANLR